MYISQRKICIVAHLNMLSKLCIDVLTLYLKKIGRIASDDVLELFKKKCLPVLLYGTEACPLKKSHIASFQFVVKQLFC